MEGHEQLVSFSDDTKAMAVEAAQQSKACCVEIAISVLDILNGEK